MKVVPPPESSLTSPTLSLFPTADYIHLEQVRLGRKSIDVICLQKSTQTSIAIELKVANWKRALWQASVNLQVAHRSYIALWHEFTHRAVKNEELIKSYGVGLISVSGDSAQLVFPSQPRVRRLTRNRKREWYEHLVRASE